MFWKSFSKVALTGAALAALLMTGTFTTGCGNDNNNVSAVNTSTVTGTVTYPAGGSANTAVVYLYPRAIFDATVSGGLQAGQTAIANAVSNGQFRARSFNTAGQSSFTYSFSNLPAGEYVIDINPTNQTAAATATETNILGRLALVNSNTTNNNIGLTLNQLGQNTATVSVSANPPSGQAAQVTFTQVVTNSVIPSTVEFGEFVLVAENSDLVIDASSRAGVTGGVTTTSATFAQNSAWGSGNVRTLAFANHSPGVLNQNINGLGDFRTTVAVYPYSR